MNRENKLITVDVRSTRPYIGKTFMLRVLWYGLKKLGYDPNNTLVSVACTDRDLTLDGFNSGEMDEAWMKTVAEKLTADGTRLHLIDLNLPVSIGSTFQSGQVHQIRSRTHNGLWSHWKPCSFETYLARLNEPEVNNTVYEVRSISHHPDGPTVQVPERSLVAIAEFCERLETASANLAYEKSYAGEEPGSLKRNARALNHLVRSLMNQTYADVRQVDKEAVDQLMTKVINDSNAD